MVSCCSRWWSSAAAAASAGTTLRRCHHRKSGSLKAGTPCSSPRCTSGHAIVHGRLGCLSMTISPRCNGLPWRDPQACPPCPLNHLRTDLEAAYSAWYRSRARRLGTSWRRHACCRRTAWHSSRTELMAWRHQAAGSVATGICSPSKVLRFQDVHNTPGAGAEGPTTVLASLHYETHVWCHPHLHWQLVAALQNNLGARSPVAVAARVVLERLQQPQPDSQLRRARSQHARAQRGDDV
jgi:hypothetical protein